MTELIISQFRISSTVLCGYMFSYGSCHKTTCFKGAEGFHPYNRLALSQQYRVASFATMQILSCIHSPRRRCSYSTVYDSVVTLKHAVWRLLLQSYTPFYRTIFVLEEKRWLNLFSFIR
jgi:hypothetical protein